MAYSAYPSLPLDGYHEQQCFHRINTAFPGVQLINEHPYIFVVNDFTNAAECQALMDLYASAPQQLSATAPAQEARRTSTSVFPGATELAWLRQRIADVTCVAQPQLEPTKVTRYAKGEFFREHTDASFLHEKYALRARASSLANCLTMRSVALLSGCGPSAHDLPKWTRTACRSLVRGPVAS